MKYSPVQQVVEDIFSVDTVTQLALTGCRQFGKSWWVFRHLVMDIYNCVDKNFAVIIPLDSELDRFVGEQLTKPFGLDSDGRKCPSIEVVRIPVKTDKGYMFKKFVKSFNRGDVPYITFYNGCKLFFFAGNANPEQHIAGNTFRLIIQDEWAKFTRDITRIILPTLLHEKGKLICTTTLNEKDPYNWFAIDIIKNYKEKGDKVISDDPTVTCGLDIYKKEINTSLSIMDVEGKLHEETIHAKSILIIGDFESIYPWIYNGTEVYKRVMSDYAIGNITEEDFQILYKCNPSGSNLQIISNYDSEINEIEYNSEIENLQGTLIAGYDQGKGSSIENRCAAGWAKVLCLYDLANPLFEQYLILESGNFYDEEAELSNVSEFLDGLCL